MTSSQSLFYANSRRVLNSELYVCVCVYSLLDVLSGSLINYLEYVTHMAHDIHWHMLNRIRVRV